jgi:hypothetical protein
MVDWTSALNGVLVGVAVGVCGKYFADKYTDRRREKEARCKAKRDFLLVKYQMPELIAEIRADLAKEDQFDVREFFLLPDSKVPLNAADPCFSYFAEQHGNRTKRSRSCRYGYHCH